MVDNSPHETRTPASAGNYVCDETLEQIRQSLTGLSFGTVTIVVQDGVVIQIERMERRRLRTVGPKK